MAPPPPSPPPLRPPPSPEPLARTDRSRLRRKHDRGSFDRSAADAVIDEALVAHVATVSDRGPIVLPMAHARVADRLYVHGSPANHILRTLASGAPACVTITLLDALVLARSAFHHSMDYRCVVLFGVMEPVLDRDEKQAATVALLEHLVPGRSDEARLPTGAELDATQFLRLPIREGSVKVRTGGPVDDEADLGWPVWAGHVPVRTTLGDPVPDPTGPPQPLPTALTALTAR